ncbi:MAG: hypothetical protein ABSB18_08110 [Candidatus Omnitrophota bacterium]
MKSIVIIKKNENIIDLTPSKDNVMPQILFRAAPILPKNNQRYPNISDTTPQKILSDKTALVKLSSLDIHQDESCRPKLKGKENKIIPAPPAIKPYR